MPPRNHHIIVPALFPKFHVYGCRVLWVGNGEGGGGVEPRFNASDANQRIFLTAARWRRCDWVSLQVCECPVRFLFSKRWRQGRRICTRNPSHLCTLYSGASFSYTPFKEGIDRRDSTYSRGCTQGYRTDSSNHRLCKISFDCRAAVISVKKNKKQNNTTP